ncbi:MAG: recombinase zinc beta ribbon domain-containing protein, partial [Clostridia bacterium]|nr:recombinase zinc beta ribbon domain-containing protein [Clostridia bacterium]
TTLRLLLTNPVYCTADDTAYTYFSSQPCQLCAEQSDFDGVHGIMPFNRTSKDGSLTLAKSQSDWIIAIGAHPGTIPGAQWVRVQHMLAQNRELGKTFQSAPTETALLSGLVRCAHCSSPMRPKLYGKPLPDGSRRFHYICTRKIDSRGELCSMPNLPGNDADKLVISYLSHVTESPFQSTSTVGQLSTPRKTDDIEQSIIHLQNDISDIQCKIDNLVDAIAAGAPPPVLTRLYAEISTLTDEIEQKKSAIADLNSSAMDANGPQELAAHIRTLFSAFSDSFYQQSYDEKRRLIRSVVDSVIWDGENVTINILGDKTLPK